MLTLAWIILAMLGVSALRSLARAAWVCAGALTVIVGMYRAAGHGGDGQDGPEA